MEFVDRRWSRICDQKHSIRDLYLRVVHIDITADSGFNSHIWEPIAGELDNPRVQGRLCVRSPSTSCLEVIHYLFHPVVLVLLATCKVHSTLLELLVISTPMTYRYCLCSLWCPSFPHTNSCYVLFIYSLSSSHSSLTLALPIRSGTSTLQIQSPLQLPILLYLRMERLRAKPHQLLQLLGEWWAASSAFFSLF